MGAGGGSRGAGKQACMGRKEGSWQVGLHGEEAGELARGRAWGRWRGASKRASTQARRKDQCMMVPGGPSELRDGAEILRRGRGKVWKDLWLATKRSVSIPWGCQLCPHRRPWPRHHSGHRRRNVLSRVCPACAQSLSSLVHALPRLGTASLLATRPHLAHALRAAALSALAHPSVASAAPLRLLSGLVNAGAAPASAGAGWWTHVYAATHLRLSALSPGHAARLLYLLAALATQSEHDAGGAVLSPPPPTLSAWEMPPLPPPPPLPLVPPPTAPSQTTRGHDDAQLSGDERAVGAANELASLRAGSAGEPELLAGAELPSRLQQQQEQQQQPLQQPEKNADEQPPAHGFVLPPTDWVEGALAAARRGFGELPPRDVARVLVALVRLRHDPATGWTASLSAALEQRSAGFSRDDHAIVRRAWLQLGRGAVSSVGRGSGGGGGGGLGGGGGEAMRLHAAGRGRHVAHSATSGTARSALPLEHGTWHVLQTAGIHVGDLKSGILAGIGNGRLRSGVTCPSTDYVHLTGEQHPTRCPDTTAGGVKATFSGRSCT
eukprot:350426-Chlamydomonas_euryale.AAC.9